MWPVLVVLVLVLVWMEVCSKGLVCVLASFVGFVERRVWAL